MDTYKLKPMRFLMCMCVCVYIYIYIYFIKKKQQTGHIRIINLFPSCYAFLKNQKTRKKINCIVFNWNHFEMRLLNLRINFLIFFLFIYCGLFVLILVVFVLFLLPLKKARGEIWPKRSERRNNTKITKMKTKKSAINT